jgi:hypothetical protein
MWSISCPLPKGCSSTAAFVKIPDPKVRRRIIDLVKSLAPPIPSDRLTRGWQAFWP